MSPKEVAHCLKLLKREDTWQVKAQKLMAVIREWYCARILFGRECVTAELSEFVFKKKYIPKEYLQHAVALEVAELAKESPEKAPKPLMPNLSSVQMLIEPSTVSDCPAFVDKDDFFQAIMTVTEALSKVGRRDSLVSTCATVTLQLLKQIIYVDEIFGTKYVSDRHAKSSGGGHAPLHIKGKATSDDDKAQS